MTLKELLGAAAVGGLAGGAATLTSTILRDLVFARHLESWRSGRELARLFRRYREPISLSCGELFYRIDEILSTPYDYLATEYQNVPRRLRATPTYEAPFYRRYKFESTAYRLCATLGWLELYREEGRFLHGEGRGSAGRLEEVTHRVQSVLGDRKLNGTPDWQKWSDRVIFREEQRAIGQLMLSPGLDKDRRVIGYREFCEGMPSSAGDWLEIVKDFLRGVRRDAERDFRLIRLRALCVHLVDMIRLWDLLPPDSPLLTRRAGYVAELCRHVRSCNNTGLFLYRPGDLVPPREEC